MTTRYSNISAARPRHRRERESAYSYESADLRVRQLAPLSDTGVRSASRKAPWENGLLRDGSAAIVAAIVGVTNAG